MVAKKFSDIVKAFCDKKQFTKEEAVNFELFVTEVFQIVKDHMESKQYDFISVRNLGTFFLKVWTVHSRMKVHEKKLLGYTGPRMALNHYRDEKRKYEELQIIYKRMTEDFFERKLYFAERKQEKNEKRLNQQLMMEIAMDDIENDNQPEKDETDRNTETSLGEQE